jgi:hypothetical protein
MSVFARSDVASVALSASHGGCGQIHTRPAPGGVPVNVWELECPQCEEHLRRDSLWAPTAASIPETPDEALARTSNEKRTAVDQAAKNLEAMEKLGNMPEALAQALAQYLRPGQSPMTTCPAGHSTPASASFCGECGSRMPKAFAEVPPMALEALPEPVPTEEPQDEPKGFLKGSTGAEEDSLPDFEDMSLGQLKKLATSYGAPTRRSKEDQITALRDYLKQ